MGSTVTNLDSYVNGCKVVTDNATTVTLENGSVVKKNDCKYVSFDAVAGATYYHCEDD